MALEIWWFSGSPFAWWVMLVAEAKGLAYEGHLLSVSKREHRTPEYLAMNPRGQVPLLRDGDFILSESLAIVAYLDAMSPSNPLLGTTTRETARIWEAVSEVLSGMQRVSELFADPILFGRAKPDEPQPIRDGAARLKTELGFLEARVAASPYLCGKSLSAADLALLPLLLYNLRAAEREIAKKLDLGIVPLAEHYPGLAAWVKRIEALPGYDRTYPPHWRG
jgi:glutathione S-transferase